MTKMQKASAVFIATFGLSAAIIVAATGATADQNELTPEQVFERQRAGEVFIVDVRTPMEYAAGHVEGAVNLPLFDVEASVSELRRVAAGRSIVLYCRSGRRAEIAEEILNRHGIEDIWHLRGQFSGWRRAGLPVGAQ